MIILYVFCMSVLSTQFNIDHVKGVRRDVCNSALHLFHSVTRGNSHRLLREFEQRTYKVSSSTGYSAG